ncbi:MAG TPA: hypothetical protein ENI34_07155 [candidate division WOR-3 bacterium]|uniref:Uncharacterized protein n=1 Tax=candidate division WOR-3 bacterium TaxID=2052148 RepID=A0A9C9EMX8_UNCW3|nr:hypothetical protein [candidate division WOR-3 bacterium]
MKNGKILFPLIFLHLAWSQVLTTVRVDFEKYTEDETGSELICGTIYHKIPHIFFIQVSEPINQIVISQPETLIIYYPEDTLVFKFSTDSSFAVTLLQPFLGALKEDYGLTDLGYQLSRYERRGDTLMTWWRPSGKPRTDLNKFFLVYISNAVHYVELKRKDGTPICTSRYGEHLKYGDYYFPLEISTVYYEDGDSTIEKIKFFNPGFNIELPETVLNFKPPPGVKIEKIPWE